MDGYIHSVESFGTVDGPGVRFVVFMQGCPLRCKYCHNPDTWKLSGGTRTTADGLLEAFNKNRPFYSNGGLTVTGGEPLLQTEFLTELFGKAKEQGIHTCIDTSGATYRVGDGEYIKKLDALMSLTDLVMLDIKHIGREEHRELTGIYNDGILAFAKYLEDKQIPVWIRHVLVTGITDSPQQLKALGAFLGTLSNVKAIDILPYHTMGVHKYSELGMAYPLEGVQATTAEQKEAAKRLLLNAFYASRRQNKHTSV